MNLACCHKFPWFRNKGNITLEEIKQKKIKKKRARKGETTAAISSSGFIWSDQRSDLWQSITHSWSHQWAS